MQQQRGRRADHGVRSSSEPWSSPGCRTGQGFGLSSRGPSSHAGGGSLPSGSKCSRRYGVAKMAWRPFYKTTKNKTYYTWWSGASSRWKMQQHVHWELCSSSNKMNGEPRGAAVESPCDDLQAETRHRGWNLGSGRRCLILDAQGRCDGRTCTWSRPWSCAILWPDWHLTDHVFISTT